MPRYIIERSVPGLTRDELMAAGRRSAAVLAGMPDVRWIRSYVSDAEGKIYCEYDAPSADAIREHARRAGCRSTASRRSPWRSTRRCSSVSPCCATLSPARRLVRADPEQRLGDDLVRQHRVRRMDAAEARVAEQLLEPAARKMPNPPATSSARSTTRHDAFDRVILGGEDLRRPRRAVIDAVRPVVGDPIEMRPDRLEREPHLAPRVLQLGVVGHRPRQRRSSASSSTVSIVMSSARRARP